MFAPDLDESFDLEIKEGRHPVIENNCLLVCRIFRMMFI